MSTVDWNAIRFDARQAPDHVESYFLKANEPNGERALWLKATVLARRGEADRAVAEGWAIAFDRRSGEPRQLAVKHTLPLSRAAFGPRGLDARWETDGGDRLVMRAAPEATEGLSSGLITRGDRRIGWELSFRGEPNAIAPLPSKAMYDPRSPTSKLVTPYPDFAVSGHVEVCGERWSLDGWRGMQGHNWGRRHADLYGWGHVNVWDEDVDVILEGLSARVRVGPLMLPFVTLVCVRHRGVRYDFTGPATVLRAHGDVTLRSWSFTAESKNARIEGVFEAKEGDMVGLEYQNPRGPTTYCLNSKLASARVRFEPRGRPALTLTSRAAALEIGTHRTDHGVAIQA